MISKYYTVIFLVIGNVLKRPYHAVSPKQQNTMLRTYPVLRTPSSFNILLLQKRIRPDKLYCNIHKHALCDGISDCNLATDETTGSCEQLTDKRCERRFRLGRPDLRIPLKWVGDGEKDCVNGLDENMSKWEVCGLARRIKQTNICRDALISREGDVVEIAGMCRSSEIEIAGCRRARPNVQTTVRMVTFLGGSKVYTVALCFKGLTHLNVQHQTHCSEVEFKLPVNQFFGENQVKSIVLSKKKQDCRYLFGEAYVFYSCLGLCKNTTCPLTRPVLHTSCGNLGNKAHSYNLASGAITTILREKGEYHNDIFVCENSVCVAFEQVCDTVNDCGDYSDERDCTNNFRCKDNSTFLSLEKHCNGEIDCNDLSDECNDSCKRGLVKRGGIAAVALIMGVFGVSLGLLYQGKTLWTDPAKKSGAYLNQVFVLTISFGDTLTGLYLLLVTIQHFTLSKDFCTQRMEWLSSGYCKITGIIGTTGASISSLSMAIISGVRFRGAVNATQYRQSKDVTLRIRIKTTLVVVGIIGISVVSGVVPIAPGLEDWFVNGVRFDKDIPIFRGVLTKHQLAGHVRDHYEARGMKHMANQLSWARLKDILGGMFTKEYGGVHGHDLSFYGNDPVCLFKYFVRPDDPQYHTTAWYSVNRYTEGVAGVYLVAREPAGRTEFVILKTRPQGGVY
eukprot:sb/3462717/